MECLDANAVQDLMAGALDGDARAAVLGHLDACAECRELLAITAREASARGAVDPLGETRAGGDPGLVDTVDSVPPPIAAGAHASPEPGAKLGRYRLIERLGSGAMGVVWRAEDPGLGRDIALKLLKRPDAALTERLVREARSMAQVNDPNVVAVYDVGVADGVTYIAMELVEGTSLRQWQQAATSRAIPEIVEQYIAAGRGLAAAHRAGLVHRDFKPDNVLVGRDGRVRVTDFGLAAAKPSETGTAHPIADVNLTTQGSVLGTPAYMSPEQFTGGHVDSRTDQFNFCVALYEALYGERPFDGKTFDELGQAVCAGRMKPIPDRVPVSRGLRAILLRGMAAKPGDRFPTMDHLLAELGRDRARPWRRASRIGAALAAVLVLGLAADYTVRARGERGIAQAFAATGTQAERARAQQAKQFRVASALLDVLPEMYELTSKYDEAAFGLQSPEDYDKQLREVHDLLASASWDAVRALGPGEIAVADRDGRLVYSSAAPDAVAGELGKVPAIARALAGDERELLAAVHYDEPAFAAAKLFGAHPSHGLALMFVRPIVRNDQIGGLFLQFIDGKDVLAGIRLDDDTQLGLVAGDGPAAGDVPVALAAAAPPDGAVAEVTSGGTTYQVQARPLDDFASHPIAQLVMARPLRGVLALFPHARAVFALAAACALALSLAAALRARRITGARV